MPDPVRTGAHPDLQPLLTPIDSLRQYHRNPNNGDTDTIADSLRTNGQYRPVVVNRGTLTGRPNEILGGNHTYAAALELGWTHLAASWVDVDDDRAARIVAVDNRSAELARRDPALLADLLGDLPDLTGTGYTQTDLDQLLADLTPLPPAPDDADDAPPVPPDPFSKPGDLWHLGPHRVLCGDSTDVGNYDRLLGDEKAHCVWTDPPYGVAVVGGSRALSPEQRRAKGGKEIDNDALDVGALTDFLREALGATVTATRPGAAWYVAAPHAPVGAAFSTVLGELDVWRHSLVWVKDSLVLGRADYHYRHEVLYYGWTPGGPRLHPVTDRTQTTVIEVPRPKVNKDHPTMKPVALVQKCLDNSTERGWTVLDPFGGSGTTLLAAHLTGRQARLVELDPRYVDVICRRYQQTTGTLPILEQTGEPHDFTADTPPTGAPMERTHA